MIPVNVPTPEDFEKISSCAHHTYNNCGQVGHVNYTYHIPMQPYGINGEYAILICSKECVEHFCARPDSFGYINERVKYIVRTIGQNEQFKI